MDDETRIGEVMRMKEAIITIEKVIDDNDEGLSKTLEEKIGDNTESIKEDAWEGCKGGICPADLWIRYPEESFLRHMEKQNRFISSEDIVNMGFTLEDIEAILNNQTRQPDRGDSQTSRTRRWNLEENKYDYWCDGNNTPVMIAAATTTILTFIAGCIILFIGAKRIKSTKKMKKDAIVSGGRAKLLE